MIYKLKTYFLNKKKDFLIQIQFYVCSINLLIKINAPAPAK